MDLAEAHKLALTSTITTEEMVIRILGQELERIRLDWYCRGSVDGRTRLHVRAQVNRMSTEIANWPLDPYMALLAALELRKSSGEDFHTASAAARDELHVRATDGTDIVATLLAQRVAARDAAHKARLDLHITGVNQGRALFLSRHRVPFDLEGNTLTASTDGLAQLEPGLLREAFMLLMVDAYTPESASLEAFSALQGQPNWDRLVTIIKQVEFQSMDSRLVGHDYFTSLVVDDGVFNHQAWAERMAQVNLYLDHPLEYIAAGTNRTQRFKRALAAARAVAAEPGLIGTAVPTSDAIAQIRWVLANLEAPEAGELFGKLPQWARAVVSINDGIVLVKQELETLRRK